MKSFKDLVQLRRSHRKFTDQPLTADEVKTILRAALMSPTSKNRRAWHFVVVEDKTDLQKLADAKELYASDPALKSQHMLDINAQEVQGRYLEMNPGSQWSEAPIQTK